ncbi:tryptophan synthase beta subunit-like PLP-dependent enzyme [Mycena metata]|uniref:Probable succinyl-diaminopimelate desuccinylase n=1 Tax=Mycena metata TaxID=1033252 RepID=A0AAD7HRQ8_9AGAR|nr:tryptophan synthase beta subunit-like PLP-dependent enzyme [Mycena metata]
MSRRSVYFNQSAQAWVAPPPGPAQHHIDAFHRTLPNYHPTDLIPLDKVAKELALKAVYLKNESVRLDLPSFKILGASWGAFRALVQKFSLPSDAGLDAVKKALSSDPTTLFAATDGNHGRAVARIGKIFGTPVHIFVPAGLHLSTIELISSEGATVTQIQGSYDEAVNIAHKSAQKEGGLLVQDTAFEHYEEIPQYIVDGYTTLLAEVTNQLSASQSPTHIIVPVGVGSFAQAVTSYYHQPSLPHTSPQVITVEPDTAACLYSALTTGSPIPLHPATTTIMTGLDCGTVSSNAWPILRHGVSAALSVSDHEAHLATLELNEYNIAPGPCGAAPLAALRHLVTAGAVPLGLSPESVVVLICTEGAREYEVPRSVAAETPTEVTQALVQIDSSNPMDGRGPGERAVAEWIVRWLAHRAVETFWVERVLGRPSVVAVVRGTGGGKRLMLNGHIDTVTLAGYDGDALSGEKRDGRVYGRGAADMKCGVAAALVALVRARDLGLRGDVIFAGVADEEALSIGTEDVLAAGWTADGAVVNEPSGLDITISHKGFVWCEVDVLGRAAHGSRPDLGIDAISLSGYFLVEVDKYAKRLLQTPGHPELGRGSVHASIVKGGEEVSSYPAKCTITLERRTVPGETVQLVEQEVKDILERVKGDVRGFEYALRVTFARSPFEISKQHPFVELVARHVQKNTGKDARFRAEAFWADSALLADKQIPVVIFGPYGEGLHAKEEWVDVQSLDQTTETLLAIAREFCA